jgi:hypothetical protein
MEFWHSPDLLSKMNTYLQVALVFFGVATVLIGAASFIVSHRKASLEGTQGIVFKKQVESIDGRTSGVKVLVWREFTKEQSDTFVAALKNSNMIEVLAVRNNSKESQHYSAQIEKAFETVGWRIERFLPPTDLRKVISPTIGINDSVGELPEFNALKQAIESAGLPFTFDEFKNANLRQPIILDVGIIPANEYQSLIDKIN